MTRTHRISRRRSGPKRTRPWRFVVAIDVNPPTVDAAYAHLHVLLACCAWESSEEAYDPRGEPIDEERLAAARMRVLAAMPFGSAETTTTAGA